ncbi:MAG TPA: ABC transporter permease [Thermoanaerobaculia bacterium]|nr:ABC transporter permease [Thermoanaerobaculia bacterium]
MKATALEEGAGLLARFGRDRLSRAAACFILLVSVIALFAPLIAGSHPHAPVGYGPDDISLPDRLQPPGAKHWLGTDELGRDLLSRVIHGSRVSMTVGSTATLISLFVGTLFGALAGFYRGVVDTLISRLIEIVLCFPFIFLLLAITALYRPSLWTVVLALGLTSWTTEARIIRGEFLRVREMEFAEAARASGAGDLRVIFRHLLPHAVGPVLVFASFGVASAILTESALSFLGFGIPLPTASWGGILSTADDHLTSAWWLPLFPGLLIFLTAAAFNVVGEGFRRALDPTFRE